jgi:hypothetical protein
MNKTEMTEFLTSQDIFTERDIEEMFEECDVIGQSFSRGGYTLSRGHGGYRLTKDRDERWPSWMSDTQDA